MVPPGINLCLFSSYVYILRFRRARKISPIIFWVAVSMFCFSTAHVALGFYRLIRGFIELCNAPGGPGAYFADVSTPPNVLKVLVSPNAVFCAAHHESVMELPVAPLIVDCELGTTVPPCT